MASLTSQRDVKLLISAEDTSGATLAAVAARIDQLTSSLNETLAAAKRGDVPLGDLTNSLKELDAAGKLLAVTIPAAGRSFDSLQGVVQKNSETLDNAIEKFLVYQAEIGDSTPTEKQVTALARLEKSVNGATAALANSEAALETQRTRLQALGVDTNNLAGADDTLRTAAINLGTVLKATNEAVANYAPNVKAYTQSLKDAADIQVALNPFASRDEILATVQAQKDSASYTKFLSQALDERDAKLRNLHEDTSKFDLQEEADKEKLLALYGKLADAATAAAKGVPSLGLASVAAPTQTASASVLAAIDPRASARQTLQGIEDEVSKFSALAEEAAGNSTEFNAALNLIGQNQRAVMSIAALGDKFVAQRDAVASAQGAYDAGAARLAALAEQARNATGPVDGLQEALQKATAELNAGSGGGLAGSLEKARAALAATSTAMGAAGLNINELDTDLARLTAAANTGAAAVTKLQESSTKAGGKDSLGIFGLKPYELQNLSYQINDVVTQLGSGTKISQVFAQQGGQILQIWPKAMGAILAVLPEVAVGLGVVITAYLAVSRAADQSAAVRKFSAELNSTVDASRTSAVALLAIRENFESLGISSADATTAIQGFIAKGIQTDKMLAFAKAAKSISDVYGTDFKTSLDTVTTGLTGNIDSIVKLNNQYDFLNENQFAEIQRLTDQGKYTEANTVATAAFIAKEDEGATKANGPWTQAVRAFGQAWRDFLDDLSGGPLVQGALHTIEALVGGLTSLLHLATTAKVATGNAAVDAAQNALNDLLAKQKTQDGIGDRTALTGGTLVSTADITAAQQVLALAQQQAVAQQKIADASDHETTAQKLAGEQYAKNAAAQLAAGKQAQNYGETLDALYARARLAANAAFEATHSASGAEAVRQAVIADGISKNHEAALVELRSLQDRTDATNRATDAASRQAAVVTAGNEAARKEAKLTDDPSLIDQARKAGAQVEINRQNQEDSRKAAEDARKAASAGQEALNALLGVQEALDKQNLTDINARLNAVSDKYQKLYAAIDKARAAGVTQLSGGLSLDDARVQLKQAEDQEKELAGIKGYQDAINAAVGERTTLYKDLNDQVANGSKTAADAAAEASAANDDFSKQIAKLATDGLIFSKSIKDAKINPQIQIAVTNLNAALHGAGATTGTKSSIGTEDLDIAAVQMKKINDIIADRNELVSTYKTLADDPGGISDAESQKRIQKAFDETNHQLRPLIDSQQEYYDQQLALGHLTPITYEKLSSELTKITAQSKNLNTLYAQIAKTFEDSFTSNSVTAFDTFGKNIAGAIKGTESWGEAFKNAGGAIETFFASLLQDIANAIIQIQALALAKKIAGIFGGGGGDGGFNSAVSDGIATIFHAGGVVGSNASPGSTRSAPTSLFLTAPRYHSGSGVGLAADERAAILQTGEEVLSRSDARNVLNGSSGRSQKMPDTRITVVPVIGEGQIAAAMSGAAGEKVVLAHVSRNARTVRKIAGNSR